MGHIVGVLGQERVQRDIQLTDNTEDDRAVLLLHTHTFLLYTSDAADEKKGVDPRWHRIHKKKKRSRE